MTVDPPRPVAGMSVGELRWRARQSWTGSPLGVGNQWGTAAPAAMDHLGACLGDSPGRWEMLETLVVGWQGTVGELAQVIVDLVPEEAPVSLERLPGGLVGPSSWAAHVSVEVATLWWVALGHLMVAGPWDERRAGRHRSSHRCVQRAAWRVAVRTRDLSLVLAICAQAELDAEVRSVLEQAETAAVRSAYLARADLEAAAVETLWADDTTKAVAEARAGARVRRCPPGADRLARLARRAAGEGARVRLRGPAGSVAGLAGPGRDETEIVVDGATMDLEGLTLVAYLDGSAVASRPGERRVSRQVANKVLDQLCRAASDRELSEADRGALEAAVGVLTKMATPPARARRG